MKNFIGLIIIFSVLISSCKNENESIENSTKRVIPFTEVGNQMRNEAAVKKSAQPNQTASSNASVGTKKGMNPPHGQVGHRCDLPVGAPLNSTAVPAKSTSKITTTPQMTVTPSTITATATTPPSTPTPEGMNPPHGQEGHRCDIAVGAALPKE